MANPSTIRQHLQTTIRRVTSLDPQAMWLFRIVVGCVLLLNLGQRVVFVTEWYSDQGILPRELNWQLRETDWAWSIHGWFGSAGWVYLVFFSHALAGIGLICGFYPRVAAAIAWLLSVSMHHRNPLLVTGGDILLAMLLFWAALLPLQRCRWKSNHDLSSGNDNNASPDHSSLELQPDGRYWSWATLGLTLQMWLVYAVSGWSKWNETWWTGEALIRVMDFDHLVRDAGIWLRDFPMVLRTLTIATLVLELIAPWMIIFPFAGRGARFRLVRNWAIGLLVAMHLGIELTMNVLIFSWASIAGLVAMWHFSTDSGPSDSMPQESSGEARSAEAGRQPVGWLQRGQNAIAIVGLVLILSYQLAAWYARGIPAAWIEQPAAVITWNQRWTMFSNPQPRHVRWAMVTRLADERVVDLLRDGLEFDETWLQNPDMIPRRLPQAMWARLTVYLHFEANARYRQTAAEYRIKTWDANHPSDRKVMTLDYLELPLPQPHVQTQARLWAQYDALARGQLRNGQRHGNWQLYHSNEQLAAEGAYQQGRRTGKWRSYNQQGQLVSEGSYRQDKPHGVWRYWDADGRVSTIRFDSGRIVPD